MPPTIEIESRQISSSDPVYLIAEISANHNQSFERAVELIHEAKRAGADAVKLQTYTPDTLTIDSYNPEFTHAKGSLWEGRTLYSLYKEAYLPWEWYPDLQKIASKLGLTFFSTAYDETAVELLKEMDVPAYKIASFELVDIPLLRLIASTGKPVILSTGMATLDEIAEAVRTLRESGCEQLALLKCCSAYPSPPEEMNLRTIVHLSEAFCVPVGLSDHTLGIAVPAASVALGACIIEKHFTLSRSLPSPDSAFSLEPNEFKEMVEMVRTVEKAVGGVYYGVSDREKQSRVFRRSLFVVKDINAGEHFSHDNVRSIRPGHGLHTRHLQDVVGRRATMDIASGTPLRWGMVGGA